MSGLYLLLLTGPTLTVQVSGTGALTVAASQWLAAVGPVTPKGWCWRRRLFSGPSNLVSL